VIDEEYLTRNGWHRSYLVWYDPLHGREVETDAEALCIQRARDAAEERKAWVRFAAAATSLVHHDAGGMCSPSSGPALSCTDIAGLADAMLGAYRSRFGGTPETGGGR
jgi:hypothetical protein